MNKMKKKGFTLVEVLIIVSILAVIVSVVLPTFLSIRSKVNSRAYEKKKELILEASKLYGLDNSKSFKMVGDSIQVTIEELIINDYLNPDVKYGSDNCSSEYGCVINSETKESLNNLCVVITKKGINVYDAQYIENESECSK